MRQLLDACGPPQSSALEHPLYSSCFWLLLKRLCIVFASLPTLYINSTGSMYFLIPFATQVMSDLQASGGSMLGDLVYMFGSSLFC